MDSIEMKLLGMLYQIFWIAVLLILSYMGVLLGRWYQSGCPFPPWKIFDKKLNQHQPYSSNEQETNMFRGGKEYTNGNGKQNATTQPLDNSIEWLHELVAAQHVLIIGQSGAGKTVLTHTLAMVRAKTSRVVVCDPDSRPGMWPGCEVVGGGDNYSSIETMLQGIQQEIEYRRQQRALGQRDFAPLTLVLSETSDILRACPTARSLFETMLRRARKINASLLVDVQDDQVKTLDIEGASKLKVNFTAVVDMRRGPNGIRIAKMNGEDHLVPNLPDPEKLADEYARKHPDISLAQEPTTSPSTPPSAYPQWSDRHRIVLQLLANDPAISIRAVARAIFDGNSGGEYSRMAKEVMREVVSMTGFRSQALDEIDGVQQTQNISENECAVH